MPEYAQMPINIKVEKAKNELRYGLNAVRKSMICRAASWI